MDDVNSMIPPDVLGGEHRGSGTVEEMSSKMNHVSTTYQVASDSEVDDQMQATFQDSVFDADDYDDVDASFPTLGFLSESVDKKLNSCPGNCENKESFPVSNPDSTPLLNHVTMADSSVNIVDEKVRFDASVCCNQSCFYANDFSSQFQVEALTADSDFLSLEHKVNQDFVSSSALFSEPKHSVHSGSFDRSRNPMRLEIQNDLTDFQCNSSRISDNKPHLGLCSHENAADIVVYNNSAVHKHGANSLSNDFSSDLTLAANSQCVMKFNDSMSRVADVNGTECEYSSVFSVTEGANHSVIRPRLDPCLGQVCSSAGENSVNKRNVSCGGLEQEGPGSDFVKGDQFYALKSSPWPDTDLKVSDIRSSTEGSQAQEDGPTGEVDEREKCLDEDEDLHEEDDYSEDEEEEQNTRYSLLEECNKKEDCSNDTKLEGQESQRKEFSFCELEMFNDLKECSEDEEKEGKDRGSRQNRQGEKKQCSDDEEKEQNDKTSRQEGFNKQEECCKNEDMSEDNNFENRHHWQIEADTVAVVCFGGLNSNSEANRETAMQQISGNDEKCHENEKQEIDIVKCTKSDCMEISQFEVSKQEEIKQCRVERKEKDMPNESIDETEASIEAEVEECKVASKKESADEAGTNDGIPNNSKATKVLDDIKEDMQSNEKRKEEIQSNEKRKEEIQNNEKRKEEMQSNEKRKEEMRNDNEKEEEVQINDEREEDPKGDRNEVQGDARKTDTENFYPSTLSSAQDQHKDLETQLQHDTKEQEVKDITEDDEDIGEKIVADTVEKEDMSKDTIEIENYRKDKNEAGWINLPHSLQVPDTRNCRFVLNFGLSDTATQNGNCNLCSDRVEADVPGKDMARQLPCSETSSRIFPLTLDYMLPNDATQSIKNLYTRESIAENCCSLDLQNSFQKEFRENNSSSDAELIQSQSNDLPHSVTTELEKFLVPPACLVIQSNIKTPQEDLGFAKVPGYIPQLDSMEEENEVATDDLPDELRLRATREVGVPVDMIRTSVPETEDLKSDQSQTSFLEDKHDLLERKAVSAQSCTLPKELLSPLQLPMMSPSFPLQLSPNLQLSPKLQQSPNLQLSPKLQSRSARPNSLIGLSKPDVNLPSLKPDFKTNHPDSVIHEDSSGLIRAKHQEDSVLTRKRFTFPTCGNFASSTLTEVSLVTSPCTLETSETLADRKSTLSAFQAQNEVLPVSESRLSSSSLSRPLAQRPTSWSQPPLKSKSILPKRPNSLNITVSNALPVRPICSEGPSDGETTTMGLRVPRGTPCLDGSTVLGRPLPASSSIGSRAVSRSVDNDTSYQTGIPISASQDSAASVSAIPPPISSNINLRITELGKVAPVWVPDGEAPRCMQCESRFTFTRRRHHCRACGKVFCSGCCSVKVKLGYLDRKEGRVCSRCRQDLLCAQLYENLSASHAFNNQAPEAESRRWSASASSIPSTAKAPSANALKRENSAEPKPVSVLDDSCHDKSRVEETDGRKAAFTTAVIENERTGDSKDNRVKSLLSSTGTMSPQVIVTSETSHVATTRAVRTPLWPDCNGLNLSVALMTETSIQSKFTLLPNLKVSVSIVNLDCCMGRVCWCFVSNGLCTVGQDEVVIVLERLPDEERIPTDIFCHICELYHQAAKGDPVGYLGHMLVAEDQILLESVDHAGFLYLRPTFQCLQKLPLPPAPYLFGILIHRMEVPWLQVFPTRLMLRLGAEYRYYPCPLVSMRFREPVYREIGHTIMNLLVDLRNFQYRLPRIEGLVVHMEDRKTFVNLPRSQYRDIKRAFNNNNDHIVALELSFSCTADSHLVCVQNSEGKYITQAINIQNRPRKITGASFVVFNGALRPISGMHAKCSMVEDGLMVQLSPESMRQLKHSISNAVDYSIGCGRLSAPEPEEWVILKWVDEENDIKRRPFYRIRSPIDGLALDGTRSRRISVATDYVSESLAIRWTEIFYLENPVDRMSSAESRRENDDEFEEAVAQACCMALCHHLEDLQLPALTRIGLRVISGPEQVGYRIGANCRQLPDACTRDLDSKLIPVLQNPQGCYKSIPSTVELFFYLLEQQQHQQPRHRTPEP